MLIEWEIGLTKSTAKFQTMTLEVEDRVDDDLTWSAWAVMREDAEGVEPVAEGFADDARQGRLMAENVAYAAFNIDVVEIARSALVETLVKQAIEHAIEGACKCICALCARDYPLVKQGVNFYHTIKNCTDDPPCDATAIRRGIMKK